VTAALLFAAGAGYAGCLWVIATGIARRRTLVLGRVPYLAIVLCGGAAVAIGRYCPPDVATIAGATLIGAIVCAVVDARTGLIFDALSLSMIVAGCLIGLADGHFVDGAIAAGAIGAMLAALYLVTGRRGIGLGDVKLGSAVALGFGLPTSVIAIGSAFVIGAVYSVMMIGLGRAKRTDAISFGPFIAAGAAVGLTATTMGFRW
jgi:leader peptidase (prepilin peptidase)/N-methyltransferase